MANIAVGDLVQLSFRGLSFAQQIIMVRNYRMSVAPTATTTVFDFCSNLAVSLNVGGSNSAYRSAYLACLSSSYQLQEIRVQVIKPIRYVAVTAALAVNGTRGVANAASQAGTITMFTEKAGRDQQSSVHIGPIASADSIAGVIVPGLNGALADLRDHLFDTLSPGAGLGVLDPVIWHAGVPGPTISYDIIEDGTVRDTTRVMRRRTLGVGK